MGAWLLIGIYVLLITPLRLGVALRFGETEGLRGAAGIMLWGITLQAQARAVRDAQGRLRLETTFRGRMLPGSQDPSGPTQGILRMLKALKRANRARALLKKTVRLHALTLDGSIGLEDAAATALCVAALQALAAVIPGMRSRLAPRFDGKSLVSGLCIVDTRLGTLLAVCLLGAVSLALAGKKEEHTWITPSEN